MRRLLLFLFLTAATLPAFSAKRVTVEQLEQTLAADQGKPDADIAQQLSDLELTERLSAVTLAHLKPDLPGEKAQQALQILADDSAFLDPPAVEIPVKPTPDAAAQRQMMALVVNYVTKTTHQLPNFFATRDTTRFEDRPQDTWNSSLPLHFVDKSGVTVEYRDGQEMVDTGSDKAKKREPTPQGLVSWGEFGPILSTVLLDAAQSNLAWSHWEQGPTGPEAVFRYEVSAKKSHYEVRYSLEFHERAGYHGEIAVDPANGAIFRVTVEADLALGDPLTRAAIMVEYGPVEIGGRSFICPARSVALSMRHMPPETATMHSAALDQGPLKTFLNDVAFEQYRRLGSESRMLTTDSGELAASSPASGAEGPPSSRLQPLSTASLEEPKAAASTAGVNAAAPTAPAATATNAAEAAPSAETEPAPRNGQAEAEQESLLKAMPVFKNNARDVVVDVVVTKSNGEPVLGLHKQDFAVTEDGKPQAVDFLEEHTASETLAAPPQPLPELPPNTYTNVPPVPESESVNVLLLDTLNTPQQDQAYVHTEITDFLKKMQPGTRVAIFALGSKLRYVQGFTTDTSVLLTALNDKRNGATPVKMAGTRDRGDQADDAADAARLTMMQSGGVGALQAAQGDMSAFDYGARASLTFEALDSLARYLAGVPGRKSLIWFASSFPIVIFPTVAQRASIENAHNMRGYMTQVKQTADMLTVSQVSVYPVSAEGVMTEHIMEADSAGAAGPEGSGHMGSATDATMNPYNAGAGGRADAITAMQQLAASTGGKAYFNTNDLNGALKRAINDGANYYTLSYSPTNARMDGSYRNIEVRLPNGHYTVAYRHGYNADNGLAVETEPGTDPLGPLLKLGLPSATGLLYGVRVAPATPQPAPDATRAGQNPKLKGPFTRYNVDFFIRWTDVDFQTTPRGDHSGQILIGLKAYDRDGNAVNWEGGKQAMNLKPDTFSAIQKSGIPAHLEIDLPDEDVLLVTGVYDWSTGSAGTLEVHLHPSPIAATTAVTGR